MNFDKKTASSRPSEASIEPTFFTELDLAARWQLSVKTLQKWRLVGGGPTYTKLGRAVRYPLQSVEEFERRGLVAHTSSPTPMAGSTTPSQRIAGG